MKSVGLWYESLTDLEKKIPANFLKMVNKVEEIICREFNTRFNSQTSTMVDKNDTVDDKNEVKIENWLEMENQIISMKNVKTIWIVN